YNLGFVLPIALDLACTVIRSPSADGKLRVHSVYRNESREWTGPSAERAGHWSDYVFGVARELHRAGYAIEPAELLIKSTVPEGGGLSSSAALEVASALAMLDGRSIEPLRLAQLCQQAEIDFVGMPCGIMDQYCAVFAQEDAALKIDCRDLTHEVVKLPPEVEILAVNSMVKHELAGSAYRERTLECAAAVKSIQARHASVRTLRDVDSEQLQQLGRYIPPLPARRAGHVVRENDRVEDFVGACRRGELRQMGELFVESHRSLQLEYEVSCPELDLLVDHALSIDGVYGARMTGGGFGGCTVNLVAPGAVSEFRRAMSEGYAKLYGVTPQIYHCRPAAGAGRA
ncbi:MAG: galactokinase, partial [Acidobacteria bacterium]|nr:galactokinase [Acidobacteriota bacterium]